MGKTFKKRRCAKNVRETLQENHCEKDIVKKDVVRKTVRERCHEKIYCEKEAVQKKL